MKKKLIKEKKFKKMKKDIKLILTNYIKDIKNKNILIKIFKKDELDMFNEYNNSINKLKSNKFNIKTKSKTTKSTSSSTSESKNNINFAIEAIINDDKNIYEDINFYKMNLFSNFYQIENFLNSNNPNDIKFLYFNRFNIHKILFDENEIININQKLNTEKENLNIYFYVNLLINEDTKIVNYSYSLDFIRDLNNKEEGHNEHYKKLIKAKIIIDLINY